MGRTAFTSIAVLFIICTVLYFTDCDKGGATGPGQSVSMLDGAVKYTGAYPATADVSYVNKAGQVVTVRSIPGWVSLVVSPTTSASRAENLVHGNNGDIVSQIPGLGLYWVSVTPGTESMFILAVQDSSYVLNVKPAVPGGLGQTKGTITGPVVDLNNLAPNDYKKSLHVPGDIAELDAFTGSAGGTCPASISHGQFVGAIMTNNPADEPSVSVTQYQCNEFPNEPFVYPTDGLSFQLTRIAQGAMEDNTVKVVNISQQGIWTANAGNEGNVDRHACITEVCGQLGADENAFLEQLYLTVENMDESAREHLVVTVSAGNSGLDLTGEMNFLKSIAPNAVKHIVLVGGTMDNALPNPGYNSSANADDMVFADGDNISETVNGTTCVDAGTSFAAPQVARLAAQAIKQNQGLTASQIVAAIRKASPVNNPTSVMPNGYHSIPLLSMVQTAAQTCSYSINSSAAPFDYKGGSGSIKVTVQSGCSWTAQSNVNWITATGSNTGSGTATYSVADNAGTDQRIGTITIADQTFTVTQAGNDASTLPNGFPSNIPTGNYTVTVSIVAMGISQNGQSFVEDNTDISQFASTLVNTMNTAMTQWEAGCQGSGCTCASSTVYTAWNGSSFTMTTTLDVTCCVEGVCSTAVATIKYTITKS